MDRKWGEAEFRALGTGAAETSREMESEIQTEPEPLGESAIQERPGRQQGASICLGSHWGGIQDWPGLEGVESQCVTLTVNIDP